MRAAVIVVLASSILIGGCATEARVQPTSADVCGKPKTEAEANKAAVLKMVQDFWEKKNPDSAVGGVYATDLVNHAAIPEAQGAEGMRTIGKKLFAAFPDLSMKVVDVTAEGDRVVLRTILDGTQTGALDFKKPVPATGKHVSIEQIFTYRFKDGKIVETWMTMDHLDMMKQLGTFPPRT